MQAVGYGAYQRVQVETSSPGEVIILLYDALLKNLRRAADALARGESERVNDALTRAQDITLELRTSLDANSELGEQLSPLYTYVFRGLVMANVNKDASIVGELEALITPIRDAWVAAVHGVAPQRPPPASPSPQDAASPSLRDAASPSLQDAAPAAPQPGADGSAEHSEAADV